METVVDLIFIVLTVLKGILRHLSLISGLHALCGRKFHSCSVIPQIATRLSEMRESIMTVPFFSVENSNEKKKHIMPYYWNYHS